MCCLLCFAGSDPLQSDAAGPGIVNSASQSDDKPTFVGVPVSGATPAGNQNLNFQFPSLLLSQCHHARISGLAIEHCAKA